MMPKSSATTPGKLFLQDGDRVCEFLDRIAEEVHFGRGFIPLLGSGISAASGIPTADKFSAYFIHCLEMAVKDKKDPHTWEWPEFAIVKTQSEQLNSGLRARLKTLLLKAKKTFNDPKRIDTESVEVIKNSLSALKSGSVDWRLGLECLARLFNDSEKFGVRDERIIDAFFTHLTSTRQPNFGHMMLGHLADALRIHTVLTTNFDTLLEDAFERLGMRLETFDVHKNAGLPDDKLVLLNRSIVKLHGGRYGLRADNSLNSDASEPDKEVFDRYFQTVEHQEIRNRGKGKHLLVMGASCGEKRTMSFIRYCLANNKAMRVFWVCYKPNEVKAVKQSLKEANSNKQLILITHHDIGLLLFQLYQNLYHSLPPAGADYPAFWHVPPDRYSPTKTEEARKDSVLKEAFLNDGECAIRTVIAEAYSEKWPYPRIIIIDGKKGVSSVCSIAWGQLTRDHHCVWMELDDFISPGDVFICLLTELARKAGLPPPGPFHAFPSPEQCQAEIKKSIEKSHRRFVIFLDGRDGPGHSAGWEPPDVPGLARGHQPSSRWSAGEIAIFWANLKQIFEVQTNTKNKDNADNAWLLDIVVVVTVGSSEGQPTEEGWPLEVWPDMREAAKRKNNIKLPGKWKTIKPRLVNGYVFFYIPDCIPFKPSVILGKIESWLSGDNKPANPKPTSKRRTLPDAVEDDDISAEPFGEGASISDQKRFVYAMTLFRHSRHPASLFSWGVIKAPTRLATWIDNDAERARKGVTWLQDLRNCGAIRDKPGGFIWMHRDIRNSLRERLEAMEPKLRGLRAECHRGIADWYVKLFRSSNDPLAALESLYHRLCCIEFAERSTVDEQCGNPEHLKETACVESITTLKLAQMRIVSCGYFTASSNLIQQIAQTTSRMKMARAAELNQMCQETLRDFAREAADFRAASVFNDQLRTATDYPAIEAESIGGVALSRNENRSLETQYYEGVILTGLRSYSKAEEEFHDLFQRLGFPGIRQGKCQWFDYGALDMRKMGREWAKSKKGHTDILKLAVRTSRRYMFLQMLIGQSFQYAAEITLESNPVVKNGRDSQARENPHCVRRRRYSEAIYLLATEIMRYIDDCAFLEVENAYIRTLYGVLLATLGRSSEAHRRLNEASAYLAHSPKRTDALAEAVLDLRRAETYLFQAEDILWPPSEKKASPIDGSKPKALAFLEDAYSCLARAKEYLLTGQRKDAWWWTHIYELQLRACSIVRRGLCDSNKKDCANLTIFCDKNSCKEGSHCKAVMEEAKPLVKADPFRWARLTKLYVGLLTSINTNDNIKEKDTLQLKLLREGLKKALEQRQSEAFLRYPLDEKAEQYIITVLNKLR